MMQPSPGDRMSDDDLHASRGLFLLHVIREWDVLCSLPLTLLSKARCMLLWAVVDELEGWARLALTAHRHPFHYTRWQSPSRHTWQCRQHTHHRHQDEDGGRDQAPLAQALRDDLGDLRLGAHVDVRVESHQLAQAACKAHTKLVFCKAANVEVKGRPAEHMKPGATRSLAVRLGHIETPTLHWGYLGLWLQ